MVSQFSPFTMQVIPVPMRARGGATVLSLAEAVTVRRTPSLGALSPPLASGHVMGRPQAEGRHSYLLIVHLLVLMRHGKVIRYEESSQCSINCINGEDMVGLKFVWPEKDIGTL